MIHCCGRAGVRFCRPTPIPISRRQLRTKEGAPLGDVFAFVSGLYFVAKLAYARRFAAVPDPTQSGRRGRNLRSSPDGSVFVGADTRVTSSALRALRPAMITENHELSSSARAERSGVLREIGSECDVVLLGSVASPK